MKLIKTLRRAIASTFSKAKRRPASQPPRQERGGGPKNGRLTVAVAVSILVMIGLGAINIRLIRDPSIAGKAFKPIFSNRTEPDGKTQPLSTKEAAHAKACTTPTEVTFYRNLTSQDDVGSETGNARGTGQEVEQDPKDAKSGDSKSGEKKEESKPGKSVRSQEPGVQQVQTVSIPQSGSAQKTYTVQVGAFSHPAIAQEWAQKWKARGYDVSLKPVARPKTGVIYRLYLGNFTSEKKADDLVKHLKSKEGINAIRLLVRN